MKAYIDKIIQSSETEKSLDVRPELWDRLERQLDQSDSMTKSFSQKKRNKRRNIIGGKWLAAASLAFILTITSTFYVQINSYHMEDLNTSAQPYFTKEDLSGLENLYNQPDRIVLNRKPV